LTGTYDSGLSYFSANFGFSKKINLSPYQFFLVFFGKFSQFGNQKKKGWQIQQREF
jgi:hypothetical protein